REEQNAMVVRFESGRQALAVTVPYILCRHDKKRPSRARNVFGKSRDRAAIDDSIVDALRCPNAKGYHTFVVPWIRPAAWKYDGPSLSMKSDFLVIGAGVAGLRAAIELAEAGDVLVLAKDRLQESSSAYAQGGIAAALSDDDDIELHEHDTLAA